MNQSNEMPLERPENDPPLIALFRHNMWANLRLLGACAVLDQEQLSAETVGTFGSIYDTLRHLVRSEQGYLNLLTYKKQGTPLGWDDNPGVETLSTYARSSGEGLIASAANTDPSDSVPINWWDGQSYQVPASLILTQAINHANEHRAQVMTTLTQQGVEPPDLSGWTYVEQHFPPESG